MDGQSVFHTRISYVVCSTILSLIFVFFVFGKGDSEVRILGLHFHYLDVFRGTALSLIIANFELYILSLFVLEKEEKHLLIQTKKILLKLVVKSNYTVY